MLCGFSSQCIQPDPDTNGVSLYRINWTGSALNTFYAAVRKALVVVIVVRAILLLLGVLFGGWFLFLR